MQTNIVKYVKLTKNEVAIDGVVDFTVDSAEEFRSFAKAVYQNYEIGYSKFYKMDKLSKLGFLASEILLSGKDLAPFADDDVSLILANASASLCNDALYQSTIPDVPSPAVFVYTLPNIVIGEICIKNGFKGESTFFIQEQFDTAFTQNYVQSLFDSQATKLCIVGWVEIDMHDNFEAILYLVENAGGLLPFTKENLDKTH